MTAKQGNDGRDQERQGGLPTHERRFYAQNRAFGRFGIRRFRPVTMESPHWHGHIELNLCRGAAMRYDFNNAPVQVPEGEVVCFWAGVPHRLVTVSPGRDADPLLCNIYLPVDSFLLMRFIARLQVALLAGAIVRIPPALIDAAILDRWYADYRSGDFERCEIVRMELNAVFRRLLIEPLDYVHEPPTEAGADRALSSTHVRHVISMVRYALENLDRPLRNAEVTATTGLHENYALALFTRVMRMPLKKFIVRMRLMRARAMLVESSIAIPTVAEEAGFTSISQFYQHFRTAYGVSPREMRDRYVRMQL